MPEVSVLMPCYNSALTLEEALVSLQEQTLQDIEIICVDDGSQDNTAELLNEWMRREPRLHLVRQAHQGIIPTLNSGLKACRAPYVARMDADDRSLPNRLERQRAYLEDHPDIDLVSCCVTGFPSEQVREGFRIYIDWLNNLLSDQDIRREIYVESPLVHPSVTYRREAVMKIGGYQERGWAEDYDLWLRLYLAGARFAKIPEILLEWREHPTRITRTDSRYSLENFLRAKAYYLMSGPLSGRDGLIIWGAGMMGRRLGKQLIRLGAPLQAYVDIDPHKIGKTRHGCLIHGPETLRSLWECYKHPVLLSAVGARGARLLIRKRLEAMGFREGCDWWSAA
jgi:glycosyltransferase involved in cell wall biosynthesis